MTVELTPPQPSAPEKSMALKERVELESGLAVNYVQVSDGYEHDVENRLFVQDKLNYFEDKLREDSSIDINSKRNPARTYLNSIPAIRSWKKMMPSAMALYPLQRPDESRLPNGTYIDPLTRKLFRHGLDAIGIRSRAKIMEHITSRQVRESDDDNIEWMSLACGAAVPVLDAITAIKKELPEKSFKLSLVDIDDSALDFALDLANHQGLAEDDDFTVVKADLLRGLVFSDRLIAEFGEESRDMVDMLGIFEYFDEKRAAKMLRNAHRLLKPGGKLIIGNMLSTHPNLRLNQAAIGWPSIKPRSLQELSSILEEAGISTTDCEAYVPEDGVYAVIEITKQEAQAQELTIPSQRSIGAQVLKVANQ